MNRSGCVVDASVAMKWVVDEEFTDRSRRLLQDAVSSPLYAPPLLPSEVTNALYQRMRRGNITEDEFAGALQSFLSFNIALLQPDGLYKRAYEFARSRRLGAVYDSLYVALAQFLGVELWTADQRLLTAAGAAAPWVRWIGEY